MSHTVTTTGIAAHIAVIDGQPTTTTQDIADVYGKRHDNVLLIVRQRMAAVPDEWRLRNFAETSIERPQTNGGTVAYPVIRMTKKGFHFVVGKFTGAKAVRHQIAFADEFERMEAQLQGRPQELPELNVRSCMLGGQSTPPPAGYPNQVERAIETAAWKMARESYDLAREHLRRRVAHRWIWDPENTRQLNIPGALEEIRHTTLGQCLAREAVTQVERAQSAVRRALDAAQRAQDDLDRQMALFYQNK